MTLLNYNPHKHKHKQKLNQKPAMVTRGKEIMKLMAIAAAALLTTRCLSPDPQLEKTFQQGEIRIVIGYTQHRITKIDVHGVKQSDTDSSRVITVNDGGKDKSFLITFNPGPNAHPPTVTELNK